MIDQMNIFFLSVFLLVFVFSGVRIGFALSITGLIGLLFLIKRPQPEMMAHLAWDITNSFTLTAIPVFVFMGELLLRSGISDRLFSSLTKIAGRFPGSLGYAAIVACGTFAAISGSSPATAATIGTVAYPEMSKRGYNPALTLGLLSAGGTLGILIPPSIAMIIYGDLVGVSIGKCFIAGIIPGFLLVIIFFAVILIWTIINPDVAPKGFKSPWRDKLLSTVGIAPTLLLIILVLGGIYLGVMTPTEAGAIGASGAFLLCLGQRTLSWKMLIESALSTVRITSFLFLIVIGGKILTYSLQYLQLPQTIAGGILQLEISRWVILVALYLLYLVLGMFLDPISMMIITLPVVFPAIVNLGFDPIWFAVVLVITCEMGLITPPVGLNLFVMKGIAEDQPLSRIIVGMLPFFIGLTLILALVSFFPGLATWLPGKME
jgi:tripartite ATP-independent transporter DctM subunit